MTARYWSISFIARLLGMERQSAAELVAKPHFPAPAVEVISEGRTVRGWCATDVRTWARRQGRNLSESSS